MRGKCQGDSPRLTGSIAEWFPQGQAEIALDEGPGNEAAGGGGGRAPAGSAARAAPHPARPPPRRPGSPSPSSPGSSGAASRPRSPTYPHHPHRRHRPRPALPGRVGHHHHPALTRWCARASAARRRRSPRPATTLPADGGGLAPGSGWTPSCSPYRQEPGRRAHRARGRGDVVRAPGRDPLPARRREDPAEDGRLPLLQRGDPPHGQERRARDAKVLMVAAPGRGPGREYGWWKAPRPRGAAPAPPTQRLAAKEKRLGMEQKIYTSCTLDCPDGCGIIAHVKDGRVVKLEGHPDHEFTQGYRLRQEPIASRSVSTARSGSSIRSSGAMGGPTAAGTGSAGRGARPGGREDPRLRGRPGPAVHHALPSAPAPGAPPSS